MKCVIGLGNPGKKYEKTRHNIGFMAMDELAKRYQLSLSQHKYKCDFTTLHLNGEKVMFLKPLTFMNLSGEGVRPLLDYFNIATEDVVVIYDDLDLPAGKIRLREKGGHGGHNGIRSLIDHLGTKEFKRLRIGIGRPTGPMGVIDYVLQSFSKEEKALVNEAILDASDAVESFVQSSFKETMNTFNQAK